MYHQFPIAAQPPHISSTQPPRPFSLPPSLPLPPHVPSPRLSSGWRPPPRQGPIALAPSLRSSPSLWCSPSRRGLSCWAGMEWSATSSDSAANRHGVTMAWLWDYSVVATITGPGFLGSLPPPPPLTSETATSAAAHRHRETPARSGARPCPTSPNITGIYVLIIFLYFSDRLYASPILNHRYIGIQIQCEGAGRRDLCQVVIGHELFIVVEVAHRMRK
ncbi:uncharacterized protein LOC119365002 isoform X3 [Triticum dicoccoides]|uniref:uncharacterized protein LOC119365002 isoform X3 n=1 Tax=Triticum dicoccoides TaxID=85692 RepID=UPI00188DFBF0|nr:uncharacterized protein LOC119365002 isoform X3 [Triticum dicoccoides]